MSDVKFRIDLGQGLLDIEGPQAFVQALYQDVKSAGLLSRFGRVRPSLATQHKANDNSETQSEEAGKLPRRVGKRIHPSCAGRIIELKTAKFFETPRSASDIKSGLAKSGYAYAGNQISAALASLHGRGELRRSRPDGRNWMYQAP